MTNRNKPEKGTAALLRELNELTLEVARKYGIDLDAEAAKQQQPEKTSQDVFGDFVESQMSRSSEDVTADFLNDPAFNKTHNDSGDTAENGDPS